MPLWWNPDLVWIAEGHAALAPVSRSFADLDLNIPDFSMPDPPDPVNAQTAPVHKQFEGDITILANKAEYDIDTDTYTFSDGVVATYQVDKVTADKLVVHPAEFHATATGHVRIIDPQGTVDAQDIDFTWKPGAQHGTAHDIVAHLANVTITAERAEITPEKWDFYNISGTSCRLNPPFYQLRSPHMTVYPEQYGRAVRPTVYIFGNKLVTLPDRTFNLNPRTQGIGPPSISYRRGAGLGASFSGGFLVGPTTNVSFGASSFPHVVPGYGANITRSFLPTADATHLATVRSELGERFTYGFFENIQVKTPENEYDFLQRRRSTAAIASEWNQTAADRRDGTRYSKLLEGVYEVGGKHDGFGYFGQVRLQEIRRNPEPFQSRVVLVGAAGPSPRVIAKNLISDIRVDTSVFVGPNSGWVRGIAGFSYRPVSQVALSLGGYASRQFGNSQFDSDTLFGQNGAIGRADFHLGPTQFSYLIKYDTTLGTYDREYTASQVVGCLEPFVLYREYPNTYNIGVRFRLDEFYALLRRKDFRGKSTGPVMISGPSSGSKP